MVHEHEHAPSRGWLEKFADAFRGLKSGIRGQISFSAHFFLAAAVTAVAMTLRATAIEWSVLVLCIATVLTAEMFNTALESLARAITDQMDPNVGSALDIGSAAVLTASLGAAIVGLIVLINRLGIQVGWWSIQGIAMETPTIDDIREAAARISGHAHRTPVMTSRGIDRMAGASLLFKCESLQRAGAFKFRGALNAVLSLSEEDARRGVVTHSSGNHAAALALAASLRSIPAYIVMPRDAPRSKCEAVAAYGGRITFCEPTLASRHATAERILQETGGVLVHPYDNPFVIAGQGTVALEFLEQAAELDAVIVPVSGGGLISGIALATAALRPQTAVFGVEPDQADDAFRSLQGGAIVEPGPTPTLADGLRAMLCPRTFAVIRRHVRDILLVSEEQIVASMRLIWQRMKLVVEPSGAVGLAAVLAHRDRFQGQRVGVILSGGNVDLDRLPWQNG